MKIVGKGEPKEECSALRGPVRRDEEPFRILRRGDARILAALLVCGGVVLTMVDLFPRFGGNAEYVEVVGNANESPVESTEDFPTFRLLVDVNTAEPGELMLLPGIGPRLAERIVRMRQFDGPFESVDGLIRIQGIGSKKLEQVRPFVRVSSESGSRPDRMRK